MGLEKSGIATAVETASVIFGSGRLDRLFIANYDIVLAKNVAGKHSFFGQDDAQVIFALRARREKFRFCAVCPMV